MKVLVSLVLAMFLASVCTVLLGEASFLVFGATRFESLVNPFLFVCIGILVLHFYLVWRFYRVIRRRLGNESSAGIHV